MESIAETTDEADGAGRASPSGLGRQLAGAIDPLQTLTSGLKRDVRGGAVQAHICCVRDAQDVQTVIEAFAQADGFKAVTNWSYAYRIAVEEPSMERPLDEGHQDGLDEGCGEKILGVMRRFSLQGLFLLVSRWQDYGATEGLELFGTELYSIVLERCKDLITHLKQAAGAGAQEAVVRQIEKPPPGPKNFDFSFLPPIPEPRAPTKFGPNHFLADSAMNKPASLPNLFSGGDVRLWMSNDKVLRNLPESEIWAMRFLRQPDFRIERVLQAVATLRGQRVPPPSSAPAARWGHYREVLKSATLRTELLLFDADTVAPEAAQQVMELLSTVQVSEVHRASPGAAALYEWAMGIARWRLQGPPSPEPAGQEGWVPLEPLRPREAELRKSPSPMRRSQSGPRLRRNFASGGSGGFAIRSSAPLLPRSP